MHMLNDFDFVALFVGLGGIFCIFVPFVIALKMESEYHTEEANIKKHRYNYKISRCEERDNLTRSLLGTGLYRTWNEAKKTANKMLYINDEELRITDEDIVKFKF